MAHAGKWSALLLLCLNPAPAPAQPSACGGHVCVTGVSAGPAGHSPQPAALAHAEKTAADPRCPAIPVDVVAQSSAEHRVACSAAATALELLDRCGIAPRRALHLEILREVRHPFGNRSIFGFFDKKLETVFVTQEASVPSLVAGTPYGELEPRDFYQSLVVHEVVHGVMHQNFRRQPTSHAAHEYPAYALQIASLAWGEREKFLQSIPNNAGPGEQVLNDHMLLFDPFYFAAHAYRHFSAADGCAHLNAILHGEVAFIPTLPP